MHRKNFHVLNACLIILSLIASTHPAALQAATVDPNAEPEIMSAQPRSTEPGNTGQMGAPDTWPQPPSAVAIRGPEYTAPPAPAIEIDNTPLSAPPQQVGNQPTCALEYIVVLYRPGAPNAPNPDAPNWPYTRPANLAWDGEYYDYSDGTNPNPLPPNQWPWLHFPPAYQGPTVGLDGVETRVWAQDPDGPDSNGVTQATNLPPYTNPGQISVDGLSFNNYPGSGFLADPAYAPQLRPRYNNAVPPIGAGDDSRQGGIDVRIDPSNNFYATQGETLQAMIVLRNLTAIPDCAMHDPSQTQDLAPGTRLNPWATGGIQQLDAPNGTNTLPGGQRGQNLVFNSVDLDVITADGLLFSEQLTAADFFSSYFTDASGAPVRLNSSAVRQVVFPEVDSPPGPTGNLVRNYGTFMALIDIPLVPNGAGIIPEDFINVELSNTQFACTANTACDSNVVNVTNDWVAWDVSTQTGYPSATYVTNPEVSRYVAPVDGPIIFVDNTPNPDADITDPADPPNLYRNSNPFDLLQVIGSTEDLTLGDFVWLVFELRSRAGDAQAATAAPSDDAYPLRTSTIRTINDLRPDGTTGLGVCQPGAFEDPANPDSANPLLRQGWYTQLAIDENGPILDSNGDNTPDSIPLNIDPPGSPDPNTRDPEDMRLGENDSLYCVIRQQITADNIGPDGNFTVDSEIEVISYDRNHSQPELGMYTL
ncbi:MAG: hypothetical protein ACLFTK_15970, partial [Anaerolineales bacterium]